MATEQLQRPRALRTSVRMVGITSLPDAQSKALEAALHGVADGVVALAELAHDDTVPPAVRCERISALEETVPRRVAEVVALARDEVAALQQGPLKDEALAAHAEVAGLKTRLDTLFQLHRDSQQQQHHQNAAPTLLAALLTLLEKAMALLGCSDRSTVATIGHGCDTVRDTARELHAKFISPSSTSAPPPAGDGDDEPQQQQPERPATTAAADANSSPPPSSPSPSDRRRELTEVASRYTTAVIGLTQSLARRVAVMPGKSQRDRVTAATDIIRKRGPQLLEHAQGAAFHPGALAELLEAVEEARVAVADVPPFSAKLDVQLISTDTDIACARLIDSVLTRNASIVGSAARQLATLVNDSVRGCQALGLSDEDADAVRQALAMTIIAAKEALTSSDPIAANAKFQAAMAHLNALLGAMPSKSVPKLREDTFDLLTAARKLVTSGFSALITQLHDVEQC